MEKEWNKEGFQLEEVIPLENIPAKVVLHRQSEGTDYIPPHWHMDVELNVVLMGEIEYIWNDKQKFINPGDMIVSYC